MRLLILVPRDAQASRHDRTDSRRAPDAMHLGLALVTEQRARELGATNKSRAVVTRGRRAAVGRSGRQPGSADDIYRCGWLRR